MEEVVPKSLVGNHIVVGPKSLVDVVLSNKTKLEQLEVALQRLAQQGGLGLGGGELSF